MNALTLPRLLVAASLSLTALQAKSPDTKAAATAIDEILAKDWAKHQLKGNPMSDDATFVRRIHLDIIGRIPTTRETEAFLADKAPDRRARLIQRLLNTEAHVQHTFNYWADVLRMNQNGATGVGYANFIKDSLRANKPYDKMVAEMISAQGRPWENGAIGYYYRDQGMPLDNMANTVRIFLGTRIECAQCHNHPFDKWTQMQFYQMAGFTYGVQGQNYGGVLGDTARIYGEKQNELRTANKAANPEPPRPKRTKDMTPEQFTALETEYKDKMKVVLAARQEHDKKLRDESFYFREAMLEARNNVRDNALTFDEKRKPALPKDYQYPDAKPRAQVAPAAMFGHECTPQPGETALQAYARWMTSKDNPRFTTVITNRLWKRAFGLALIEPLDELFDTTTPMVPELQPHLEKLMRDLDYDMRAFLAVLYNTQTYQRQVTREEHAPGNVYHFTGPLLRRMSAEQMWDSFITLINPDPDMPNTLAREAAQQLVLQAKKSVDAINTMQPEEVLTGMQKAADIYKGQKEAIAKLQTQIGEATRKSQQAEAKAKKAVGAEIEPAKAAAVAAREELQKIRQEYRAVTRDARAIVTSDVLIPSQQRLFAKVTGKPLVTASLTTTSSAGGESMMMMSGNSQTIRIPGYDPVVLTPEEKKAAEKKRHAAYAIEADYFGIPEKERPAYYRARDDQQRNSVRAAEIQSPAPRGHYLREFGQSDRETIENANHEASVPQALAMMNGSLLPQITSKYSQLMLSVNKAPYPDEKVEAIYMTLLSRKPTATERDTWLQAQTSGLTGIEDLVFSLLNTQQFIFVQ
ncbi:DUF1549 domain-containing protein [Prosthecobacter sp.]|uniref:DUF1549 domain-containing protein n=1 Tax=Prosthecobacter sp. TaxID=1965333 RepID=UPI002AB850D7|nr:DUF1549 domain-containing protein [Prosthecobacter sp.]MDZ4406059.1 DUF1549 domain-containing protein [Prosthecobacter sp.]